ncbi:LPXTG cell wall anchor domain-containing protein [Peribacillus sp. FSL E2-0159]|uniref:LPXTG cell wall anchor domain-containing protein n=1 Tax=Peribacillus sp. FSL E2-0159 TaxID=2975289 RepID=UPI00315B0203
MKKVIIPICALAFLSVGYSSTASASTGTVTKEEALKEQQSNDLAKKEAAIKQQQDSDLAKKEAAIKQQQGEKLPNTASNGVTMMLVSACLVALGSVFGFTRRKIKA